ncbi:DUF305 domain-containing protein [Deinococcus peraridilitoris]|uniref:DUF305 domain-containing protein n=1 Tax=Deinococcus peraridilitoris TaxID=432329 RepID=UPI0002E20395|nr:DUF305 domain-containing protein [Deinococcus peraridilitoris]
MGQMMDGQGNGVMDGPAPQGTQGGDPQRAYIERLIEYHANGLDMANLVVRKSNDARVLQIARNILVEQSREIIDMKAWLKRQ